MDLFNIIPAMLSSYIAAYMVYPIDFIKTHSQNSNIKLNIINFMKQQTIKTIYKGSFINCINVPFEKTVKLLTNEYCVNKGIHPIIAGAMAGFFQTFLSSPSELIKIHYQMHATENLKIIGVIRTLTEHNKMNIYRGASICMMRDVPFSAIYFPLYSYLKTNLTQYTSDKQSYFISGTVAGSISAFIMTPCDVIKTRYQTKSNNYNNLTECIKDIYNKGGNKAFIKGGIWRMMKSGPQFGITLFLYEIMKK